MASNQVRRFTRDDFATIRHLKYGLGWPQKRIAQHYQVSDALISKVLDAGYDEHYRQHTKGVIRNAKLTTEQVKEMRKLRRDTGLSYVRIAEIYDIHNTTARNAITGRNWADVPGAVRDVSSYQAG